MHLYTNTCTQFSYVNGTNQTHGSETCFSLNNTCILLIYQMLRAEEQTDKNLCHHGCGDSSGSLPPMLRSCSLRWRGTAGRARGPRHTEYGSIRSRHKQFCGADTPCTSPRAAALGAGRENRLSHRSSLEARRGDALSLPTHNQRSCYGVLWHPS